MSAVKDSLAESVRELTEDQARQALEFVRALRQRAELAELHRRLGGKPGYRLPSAQHPGFPPVEPAQITGTPASELLIRDRR